MSVDSARSARMECPLPWAGMSCPFRAVIARRRFHGGVRRRSGRDCLFSRGPADVLDHATTEVGIGTKLGIDATRKIPGEGFKREWPPLIKMDAAVKKKIDAFLSAGGGKA